MRRNSLDAVVRQTSGDHRHPVRHPRQPASFKQGLHSGPFLDTNVFDSAALKEVSWPADTIRWVARFDGFLRTALTELQVVEVLGRPRRAPKITPLFLEKLRHVFAAAELVRIVEPVTGCRDPKDDKFWELAVNGRADVIISGDADLLVLDSFRGIPIIAPAGFVFAHVR